jgi:septal ring factor EnvC (AmiA/AmiB activator)
VLKAGFGRPAFLQLKQSRRILLGEPAMGKTDEALKKAETEFLKKFGKNNNRQEACKPGRLKSAYIGLFTLGLLTLIIAGYVYDRRDGKPTAADFKELRSAKTRIAQLDKALTLKNHKLVELEKRLHESEKDIKAEQIARESQRTELVAKKAMVAMLQEKLKTAQSRQLHLKDEIFNSKIQIQALQVQLSAIKREIGSAETPSPVFQAPKQRLEVAPSFNLQKDSKADKSDQQADAWGPRRLSTTPDVAYSAKAASTAESDPSTAKGQSPDPAKIIDWLLKKQTE